MVSVFQGGTFLQEPRADDEAVLRRKTIGHALLERARYFLEQHGGAPEMPSDPRWRRVYKWLVLPAICVYAVVVFAMVLIWGVLAVLMVVVLILRALGVDVPGTRDSG
jgi:hypothetical protein